MRILRSLGFVVACLMAIAVAAGGLVYANAQSLTVPSSSARLTTESYRLGTPYAGTIQDMRIQQGSRVTQGQELFTLQSPTLQQAMQKEGFANAAVGYRIQAGGVMIFTAARAGVVQQVNAKIGSFVKEDAIVAQIAIASTVHLQATFSLNARDYARVPKNGEVDIAMPDGSTVRAKIYFLQAGALADGRAPTVVLARSPRIELTDYSLVGAPVAARLRLVDGSGPGTWLATQLGKLFTPGGFGG